MTSNFYIKRKSILRPTLWITLIILTLLPVSVMAQSPMAITSHPTDYYVMEGGTATFSVTAQINASTPPIAYQWQRYVSLGSIATWQNVTNGGGYSGVTTATLTITNVPLSYDGYRYRCVVTDSGGSGFALFSNDAGLFVSPAPVPPAFISHPQNRTITEGDGTTFAVSVSGNPSILFYQWQVSVNNGSSWSSIPNGGVYSGATTPTLSLNNVPLSYDGYRYRCRVDAPNFPGSWTGTSNSATLTVLQRGDPPIITTTSLPPATRGQSYCATLAATGTKPITWSIISGSLPGGLTLNASTGAICGTPTTTGTNTFTVRATNGINPDDTQVFSLTVSVPDVITVVSPTTPFCTVNEVLSVPFTLIDNQHTMKYGLRFSDDAKASGFTDMTTFENLPADRQIKITVPKNAPTKTYSATVLIEIEGFDSYRNEYPFTFRVVNNGVAIVNQPPALQSLCNGTTLALAVDVSGTAAGYQWYRNGQPIPDARSSEYVATAVGSYHVEIMGACGIIKSEVSLLSDPAAQPSAIGARVKWGNVLYVENASDKYLRYQWFHDGAPVSGATFVYYSERDGFLGQYFARCYKSDDSYDETCPVVFTTRTRSSAVAVYPTVLKSGDVLNISIPDISSDEREATVSGATVSGISKANASGAPEATVEIYSLLGVKVFSATITPPSATIRPNIHSRGNYIVKIKRSSGASFSEKIIIQ